jgi:hypothetical protein
MRRMRVPGKVPAEFLLYISFSGITSTKLFKNLFSGWNFQRIALS